MRWIGIRPRVKETKDQEARPTQLFVANKDGSFGTLELDTETDELDWVLGRWPVSFRPVQATDDLGSFYRHHVKWRSLRDGEKPEMFPGQFVRQKDNVWETVQKVPAGYEGLKKEDRIVMLLGGLGDYLAFALSRKGEEIGAEVWRTPSFQISHMRQMGNKDQDAELLVKVFKENPELFRRVVNRDRKVIWATLCCRARQEAMKARIKCEQRLFARTVGTVFCAANSAFPDGEIKRHFDAIKANDAILTALLAEEAKRNSDLKKALECLAVYNEVFSQVEGCGPAIASRLIAAIQDIRRFETPAQLKSFCGAHVLKDGRFPRRRHGEIANWHPDARQALFLFGEQIKRKPNSIWGRKLREYKDLFQERHPEVVMVAGRKRYTKSHIYNMAKWRTLTKFVEWLWKEWWRVERKQQET